MATWTEVEFEGEPFEPDWPGELTLLTTAPMAGWYWIGPDGIHRLGEDLTAGS